MGDRRIVVSIDFGTTYSGVAWAETSRPDVQHVISTWPSGPDSFRSSLKVPTELRKVATGWQWGFQIPESSKRCRFFKLRLDEPERDNDGESALELTKIYLSCLHSHFISVLEQRLSPGVVRSTPMDFVVTVPAIWSNASKLLTERAAAMAGFCGSQRIQLITEPEAAAIYTLKNLSPSTLKLGRRFVVCDAGGGTVDLISYEVTRVDKLELKEVTEGTGGRCGSSMLNMRFRRHLKQTHGEKHWTDDRLVLALNEFESFKKDFSPKGEPLTLRVAPSLGLRRNRYSMSQDEMKSKIFDPIMKDIICLVKEQISMVGDNVAAIVLVGGFGQSRYLKSRIKEAVAGGIDVLQPENGWAAVVKGAVIHGLGRYQPMLTQVGITSRVARRSFGTCLLARYDMQKHDSREAFWSEKEGEMVVTEMCWFIRKQQGESYPEGRPSCIEYQCDIPVFLGHTPQTEVEIFTCDDDGPPPVHITSRTHCVATLSLDLDKIPSSVKKTAKQIKMGWYKYYCLEGAIEASYGSAMITYSVQLGGFCTTLRHAPSAMNGSFSSHGAHKDAARVAAGPVNGGPPPSTLAAQLVENISVSSKSSRSDDNAELQRLFAIIKRVKDNPTLLKSASERIEHNHMLIYVYSRVVLENFKLDDPFLDLEHVRSEAVKAVHFLRFTIKETPSVLTYASDDHGLLFRGSEPLWVWLLPYLLKLLGHAQCLQLEGVIEVFLQYLFIVMSRNVALWEMASFFGLYLRSVLGDILQRLQDPLLLPSSKDTPVNMELPPAHTLERIMPQRTADLPQRTTYLITGASQALRQASSLARVLSYPFVSQEPALTCMVSLSENGPWLLDTWLRLREVQRRWDSTTSEAIVPMTATIVEIFKASSSQVVETVSLHRKACTLLVLLCSEMLSLLQDMVAQDADGDSARYTYCNAIMAITWSCLESRPIGRLAISKLVEKLALLSSGHPIVGPNTDPWRCTMLLSQVNEASKSQPWDETTQPSHFEDDRLRQAVEELQRAYETPGQLKRTSKKQKLSEDSPGSMSAFNRMLCERLNIPQPAEDNITECSEVFLRVFEKAAEDKRCLPVQLLSQLCCLGSSDVETRSSAQKDGACLVCGYDIPSNVQITPELANEARSIFAQLIRLPCFIESRRPRVAGMIALQRMVLHSNDSEFLDLEVSGPGQWCLQSLNSSVREIRIAAGRTLAAFTRQVPKGSVVEDLFRRNRKNSIALLRSISEKAQPSSAESCIMAWGQLGQVVGEDELNLVLIKLMEYLGSTNTLQSAFAFNELLNLAEARNITPRRLFEPFWRSLAYMATKDLVQRPQLTRAIAELLHVSVNELLLVIQTHALPWLVLDRKRDVIQKIADARQEAEIWHTMLDGLNMAAILSLLLMQETEDVQAFAKSRLDEVSPHFHQFTLVELVQTGKVPIALELLKAAGDADGARKLQARNALQTMATMVLTANKDLKHKKTNRIGYFLQSYILGLITPLTDVINDSAAIDPPIIERRRCVRALEEMIELCKDYARIARPQISACLLSILPLDELREAAMSCWVAMIRNFESAEVETLLEVTFSIVDRYWISLNAATHQLIIDMLNFVLRKHKNVVVEQIKKLPSFSHHGKLGNFNKTLEDLRQSLSPEEALQVFAERVGHENSGVVHKALIELVPYLKASQRSLHASVVSQRPDLAIVSLLRALLDCACRHNGLDAEISQLCAECVGIIGCLDSNQIESVREQRALVILNNFESKDETTDFVLFLLEQVLVPSFLSATDTRLQGFLCFAMQELLDRSEIKDACVMQKNGMVDGDDIWRKWHALPDRVKEVIEPFFTSRYVVAPMPPVTVEYPIFRPGKPYGSWLRSFAVDLLRKGQTMLADLIFEPLTRVIRVKDLSTAEFLLPYLVLHILLGSRSRDVEKEQVIGELTGILEQQPLQDSSYAQREDMKRYFHAVFRVLDYALRWIQGKRSAGRLSSEEKERVLLIQNILDSIPAELIAQRALDCNEYARALFHLEQHAQKLEQQEREAGDRTQLLETLQGIYANIDEPDGLEGISAHLPVLNINQQMLSHKKAGRWAAAQTWCEMQLAERPNDVDVQLDLLNCLKQAGQHDVLLNHVEGMRANVLGDDRIMPFAVEAAWVTGRWEVLSKYASRYNGNNLDDFNLAVAGLFEGLRKRGGRDTFKENIRELRGKMAASMTQSATTSLQAAHEILLKCHALTDLEIIVEAHAGTDEVERKNTMALLEDRLAVIGAYSLDKQYLLGIQRAAMELNRPNFCDMDISGLWLASARLARKSDSLHQSFNAVLHAARLGDDAATIENAKLLWRDNHHRKAIQMLQGAIERNKFMTQTGTSAGTSSGQLNPHQKLLTARAQLLLAKWLDSAGQTHASALREKYQQPPKTYSTWEKGHYYLGRHYKKILEAEKALKLDEQSDNYLTGEVARLVIENYVRSLHSGTKYIYQTLPRILTLWLDLGSHVDTAPKGEPTLGRELRKKRLDQLNMLHSVLDKYIQRLQPYVFYTALPQIVARIAHPNPSVFERLTHIITKVVEAYPRQALWSLIGIMSSSKHMAERKSRGNQIMVSLRTTSNRGLENLIRSGDKLARQLLHACVNGDFQSTKSVHASLKRDLGFNHAATPCMLAVPVEKSLMVTLPPASGHKKNYNPFSRDVVTISSFLDDVLVLSSLAKPRRLTARGSDGKNYMLLIKPKDDLRTDQRLMEFNGMINRSLKKDAESSRRQLYIRTYAVVPLNEECGIIEWVPGIKTIREILLSLYSSRKIYPDYQTLKKLMEEATTSESKIGIFTNDVLGRFPPMLQMWFIQQFPNPSAWFAARLRYTRSCAVMSMVGTILGLGDRHGENVNLEEGNGGIFHVDFNCLFDKGLTFATPERVPFRLTHNMVAAMGIYGYEGPFRKSSELTLGILRQQEETLMTILEAFIHDPTLDLQKEKRTAKRGDVGVKLQPQSVVDSIKRKVKGLLPNESIPLGVEGQVEELIKQAVDPRNLTAMYIGWCPFF
ncbi:hypothetical protein S40293_06413 [Stachybotrys chartarum IBT 40293]|nr:hypothetical protein S40293_06413 [Stachybotrys chartarum IBT 40293]